MRNAMFFKSEINGVLEQYKRRAIDRDTAHELLHQWELLDIEIAKALDEVEMERGE
jgi:hypothetical protein